MQLSEQIFLVLQPATLINSNNKAAHFNLPKSSVVPRDLKMHRCVICGFVEFQQWKFNMCCVTGISALAQLPCEKSALLW